MLSIITRLFTIIILFLNHNASASSRNCTDAEKHYADSVLLDYQNNTEAQARLITEHIPLGVPTSTSKSQNEHLLFQGGYISKYDEDLKTTLWTAYRLTSKDIFESKGKQRVNCFRMDPRFNKDPVNENDYDEPVFDRGHMTNDASLKDELLEQINTYTYTNMSPQHCATNRGIWLSLEYLERSFAELYKDIYVVSGAIFDRNSDNSRDLDNDAVRVQSKDGKNRVAVPSHFYKIFFRKIGKTWHSLSFIVLNTDKKLGGNKEAIRPDIIESIMSLDTIEKSAGIIHTPKIDRRSIVQSNSGEGWNMNKIRGNMEHTCN